MLKHEVWQHEQRKRARQRHHGERRPKDGMCVGSAALAGVAALAATAPDGVKADVTRHRWLLLHGSSDFCLLPALWPAVVGAARLVIVIVLQSAARSSRLALQAKYSGKAVACGLAWR